MLADVRILHIDVVLVENDVYILHIELVSLKSCTILPMHRAAGKHCALYSAQKLGGKRSKL